MAITITHKPQTIAPGFNQLMFRATSTQTAQPNFNYYVTVNVDGVALTPMPLPARPTGDLILDIKPLVRDFLKHYFPFNLSGWQTCTKSIINVTVNIGERYGTTPTIYTGTNQFFKIWNGSLTERERMTYNSSLYVSGSRALNNLPTEIKVKKDKQDVVFYYLLNAVNDVTTVEVKTYDSTNTLQSDSAIANPHTTVTTQNQMLCINLGKAALQGLLVSQVGGDFPISTSSSVKRINIKFKNGGTTVGEYNINYVGCKGRNEKPYSLYYLNRNGAFDFINFVSVNRTNTNTKINYRKIEQYHKGSYLDSSSTIVLIDSPLEQRDRVLGNTNQDTYRLITDSLSDSDVAMLEDCFNSSVYILHDIENDYYEYVNQTDTQFIVKEKIVDKVIQVQMNINSNIINERQTF
jgi:hypothetical protein